jgi:tRNA uridine 5-carboxymethylaminomethyl modification enzyme
MFTSRAEFRTILRQDNADLRLTEKSFNLGLASLERLEKVVKKKESVEKIKEILTQFSIDAIESESYLTEKKNSTLLQKQKAAQLLLRPDIRLISLAKAIPRLNEALKNYSDESLEQAEIQIKYDVYINKERDLAQKTSQLEDLKIPENFNYDNLSSLSNEALQKFNKIRPSTLGQASRISGVNPTDIQILMVYLGR